MAESVAPHVITLRDDASGWREVDGPRLTPDEPFLCGLSEERANALVGSNWALQHSTVEAAEAHRYGSSVAPVDPGEYSVDELRDHLADQDYTADELDALAEAERDGDDRTTALDAIDAARGDE